MIKKEISIAIVIGLVISGVVAGGIIRAKKAINNISKTDTQPQQEKDNSNKEIAQKEKQEFKLEITTPKDNSVLSENKLTLIGETIPNTYIAIMTETSEYLIVPNNIGQFSQEIKLIKGANTIKVVVYKENGEKQEKTLSVVYTTAEI